MLCSITKAYFFSYVGEIGIRRSVMIVKISVVLSAVSYNNVDVQIQDRIS